MMPVTRGSTFSRRSPRASPVASRRRRTCDPRSRCPLRCTPAADCGRTRRWPRCRPPPVTPASGSSPIRTPHPRLDVRTKSARQQTTVEISLYDMATSRARAGLSGASIQTSLAEPGCNPTPTWTRATPPLRKSTGTRLMSAVSRYDSNSCMLGSCPTTAAADALARGCRASRRAQASHRLRAPDTPRAAATSRPKRAIPRCARRGCTGC